MVPIGENLFPLNGLSKNKMSEYKFAIRPHHLLCMQGYSGKGYDKGFVANMDMIVGTLRSNPETKIRLLADCDNICKACPHQKMIGDTPKCMEKDEADNTSKMTREKAMLDFLGLIENEVYEIGYLFDLVNLKIQTKAKAEEIFCDNCMWLDICSWYNTKE